jgi:hypothetical protein
VPAEEPRARTDDERERPHAELVDHVVPQQRLDQVTGALRDEVGTVLRLAPEEKVERRTEHLTDALVHGVVNIA